MVAAGASTESGSDQDGVRFTFEGRPIEARPGTPIAVALVAAGERTFRTTAARAEPRGLFCGMGVCFDCLVEVDGRPNVRACQTPLAEGMRVTRQRGHGPEGGE
jgi:predicted molibdopterin-dependent oxidoreductase YjgC